MSTITDVQSEADSSFTPNHRKDSFAYLIEDAPVMAIEGDLKIAKVLDLQSDGMCCKFAPTGVSFAIGIANGDIKIYQSSTCKCIYHLADEDTQSARLPVTSLSYISSDLTNGRGDLLLATYASAYVKMWHISSCKVMYTIKEERQQTLTASVNHDATQFVTAGSSDAVLVYDLETGNKKQCCEPSPNILVMDGHRQRVFAVKHHPDSKHHSNEFITGGWDNTIQYWDSREERSIRHIFGPHICGDGLDIDGKYNHILSASWRKQDTLQVWDYKTGELIKSIPNEFDHNSMLYCCAWLGKNHIICGGSDGNMLRIIEKTRLETSGMLSGLSGGVYSLDFDHTKVARQHHSSLTSDVTNILATCGHNAYYLVNAPNEKSK